MVVREQGIYIRNMTKSDLEIVTNIYEENLNLAYIGATNISDGTALSPDVLTEQAVPIFQKQLALRLNSSPNGLFVATLEDTVVGFLVASIRKTEAGHLEGWFDDLGVRQKVGVPGIGQKLMNHAFKWAAQQGAKYVLFESGVNNRANVLFKRLGCQPLCIIYYKDITPQIELEADGV